MATQYTTTFYSGGYGKHSFPPPLFKKVFTDTNVPFSEVVKPNHFEKCDFIEIELSPKIQFFNFAILKSKDRNGFKDGISSMWFCFNLHPLVTELMFSPDLHTNIRVHIDNELWDKSMKIMKLFWSNEIVISEDESGGDAAEKEGVDIELPKLEISYAIHNDNSSVVVKVNQSEQTNFSDITMAEVVKSIKSISVILKGLFKAFKDEHCPEPEPSKLAFSTRRSKTNST